MKVLIDQEKIRLGITELGKKLNGQYGPEPITVVAIMTGSLVMLADLIRCLEMPLRISLIRASSYRGGTSAGDLHVEEIERLDIQDRDVLLIDDIFDTGKTLLEVSERSSTSPTSQSTYEPLPLRVQIVARNYWPISDEPSLRLMHTLDAWNSIGIVPKVLTTRWNSQWPDRAFLRNVLVERLLPAQTSSWNESHFQRNVTKWLVHHADSYDALYVDASDPLLAAIVAKIKPIGKPILARFCLDQNPVAKPRALSSYLPSTPRLPTRSASAARSSQTTVELTNRSWISGSAKSAAPGFPIRCSRPPSGPNPCAARRHTPCFKSPATWPSRPRRP